MYISRLKPLVLLCIVIVLFSCGQEHTKEQPQSGIWKGKLDFLDTLDTSTEKQIPFLFELQNNQGKVSVQLINGAERIAIDSITLGDSIHMPMHIFDNRISAHFSKDKLKGFWYKNLYHRGTYKMKFSATYTNTNTSLFEPNQNKNIKSKFNISGTWAVDFEGEEQSVGIFEQKGNKLKGTFLTLTGDYRYLVGNVYGEQIYLSCFDGEHAFLFTAKIQDDNTMTEGIFYSGHHWKQAWTAKRDSSATLPNPNTLTKLKEGYSSLGFSFPNLDGQKVSLNDDKFKDKVVILQILGSWCPNCMDETAFYAPLYKQYKDKGLEIIGLCYERSQNFEEAKKRMLVMKKRFGIEYELLFGGTNNKDSVAASLPELDRFIAFPTSVFIDKNKRIRRIHTGFSGPGTGIHYAKTVEEMTTMVDKLLSE